MPTPETQDAVSKLIAARTRLTKITKELNEAHSSRYATSDLRQRYARLQTMWEEALKQYEKASTEFTTAVRRAKEQIGA